MTLREIALAVLLTTAAALVVHGVEAIYGPAGWIVAGLLVAGFAVLFLTEVGGE